MPEPYLADPDLVLYNGDALSVLRELEAESVHCAVTSPPYWALRDYGSEGQLGREATPEAYIAALVEVFRELRRVLRRDGTFWLNLGDCYANKNLAMIPARVALALNDDGWVLRSEIIWSKPNPMPESVTDRPTQSSEKVYLLTKGERYFFDQEPVREVFEARPQQRLTPTSEQPGGAGRAAVGGQNPTCQGGTDRLPPPPQVETLGDLPPEAPRGADGRRKTTRVEHHEGRSAHENYKSAYGGERWPAGGRNIRNVWEIAVQPTHEAHFATFPEGLVRRCVLAGTSEHGCCPECGAPWERVVRREPLEPTAFDSGGRKDLHGPTYSRHRQSIPGGQSLVGTRLSDEGWRPSCSCYDDLYHRDFPKPGGRWQRKTWWKRVRKRAVPREFRWPRVEAVVLDPFLGSGTTAVVARAHGRRCVGIELSEDYCRLIEKRTQQLSLLAEDAA